MSEITQTRVERQGESEILNMCNKLFKEWLHELSFEEKKIWLWNAIVEMVKIKQKRRKP